MSKATRDRRNRKEGTAQKCTIALCGAMVRGTAYRGDVRMLDIHTAVPANARMAATMADGLLPVNIEDE